MLCFSEQCCRASVSILVAVVASGICLGQGLLETAFEGSSKHSVAFAVDDGGHVVTAALSTQKLGSAQLRGSSIAPLKKAADAVSRIVIFDLPKAHGRSFSLATQAPGSGLLRTPNGSIGGEVQARVERVPGKYLPFTLLQLRYDGPPPRPGTPLLDASNLVAAIAHEAIDKNSGYALPVEVLHRALFFVRQGKVIERAWVGLTLDPGKISPKVLSTVAGSPADRAGLRADDVLVEVGGMKVADYGDAVNSCFLLRPGIATRIRVRRGGGEKEVELTPVVARR